MNDPTSQGTPPGVKAARYSLAEIDAQCRKAARGAGCPWGLAEEAGKAARWLAAHGLPGPEALAGLLQGPRNCARGGDSGPECALRYGAALSDQADRIAAGKTMEADVAQPLLVFAMMGRAAAATGACFALDWDGTRAVCRTDGVALEPPGNIISASARLRVAALAAAEPGRQGSGRQGSGRQGAGRQGAGRQGAGRQGAGRQGAGRQGEARSRPVDPTAWAVLDRFAARTYAPATEASRSTGAGAGTTDND